MAYDAVKQRFPGAPATLGARVRQRLTNRVGSIIAARAGDRGVRVHFDGHFPPEDCDPRSLEYEAAPPVPRHFEWRVR